ncbi:reverse transcriptase domain-containing protein [Tanacetum coccineum]
MPIMISPDWNVPFELMCNASDFAVGADAKRRLIRWILLLQGFDIEIKDKKGAKNLAAYHLSRLENLDLGVFTEADIADDFPDEHLMILKAKLNDDEPWLCLDNVMRRCVAGSEIFKILAHWHSGPTRGHHSASITERKVYESGFFWFSIFKDTKDYVIQCDACQRPGNISSRNEMPQNNIQVKAQALLTNDALVVIKFLRGSFARFRVPKALISDRVTHFYNFQLEKALQKYGLTHKLSTAYHPQTNSQTEVTNRAIIRILEKSVRYNLNNWSEKLNIALWAFRTAYMTPTGCTPFRLVYGKACHLPVEIKHKAYWALKQCNMDLTALAKNRFMELKELMELRDGAYENTRIYKERTKKWHTRCDFVRLVEDPYPISLFVLTLGFTRVRELNAIMYVYSIVMDVYIWFVALAGLRLLIKTTSPIL